MKDFFCIQILDGICYLINHCLYSKANRNEQRNKNLGFSEYLQTTSPLVPWNKEAFPLLIGDKGTGSPYFQ